MYGLPLLSPRPSAEGVSLFQLAAGRLHGDIDPV
jgi:hypothetical protein